MLIEKETATVYRGATRRYFSKTSAERSFAVEAVKKRCYCRASTTNPDQTEICKYHDMDPIAYQRLIHLCVVMFVRS